VLLAGGSGTRLWPTSRKSFPKQFVDLTESGESLLQSSLKRSQVIPEAAPWIIVTSDDYRFLVAQQASETEIKIGSILLEPLARNTAPAIALAAFEALENHHCPKLLVQTADHHIQNLGAFRKAVTEAFASELPFVLFGVKPTRPETGYGYIECEPGEGSSVHIVKTFKEKPDLITAERYLDAGNFLWNSGMFMLDANAYLQTLHQFEPTIFNACRSAYKNSSSDLNFKRVDAASFSDSPAISIDYAVLERIKCLYVVPYHGDWSDVGTWDSAVSLTDQDIDGNAIQGDGILLDSQNTFIRAESRLVTGIGLENLFVVETRDAVLIADRTKTQSVKELVDSLTLKRRTEATDHQKVYRPWGTYETLVLGDRFRVKQIVVNPKAKLSLQKHNHRAEHWIVVSGTAEVQVNDVTKILSEDQSVYIPIGSKHRLANPGDLPLILIEVQSGDYLGEDDIVRFDDAYGRR